MAPLPNTFDWLNLEKFIKSIYRENNFFHLAGENSSLIEEEKANEILDKIRVLEQVQEPFFKNIPARRAKVQKQKKINEDALYNLFYTLKRDLKIKVVQIKGESGKFKEFSVWELENYVYCLTKNGDIKKVKRSNILKYSVLDNGFFVSLTFNPPKKF